MRRINFWIGWGCVGISVCTFLWAYALDHTCLYCLKQRLILLSLGMMMTLLSSKGGRKYLTFWIKRSLWLVCTGLTLGGMTAAYGHLGRQINAHLIAFAYAAHAGDLRITTLAGSTWLFQLPSFWSLLLFFMLFVRCTWVCYWLRPPKKHQKKKVFLNIFVMLATTYASVSFLQANDKQEKKCVGHFINPLTDVCWECLFPLKIAGKKFVADEATQKYSAPQKIEEKKAEHPVNPNNSAGEKKEDKKESRKKPTCSCNKGLARTIGIPISFWEPVRLVDVTRTPYCLVNMNGTCLHDTGTQSRGDVEEDVETSVKKSFYHVHWYIYPLIYWLELLTDFLCLERMSFDLAYITELDPFWNDDEKSFLLNPEALVFGNLIAQGACLADCIAATAGKPLNSLFWCSGCQGSLYPFTGTIADHTGGLQASLLATNRMIAKLHRSLLLWNTSGEKALCEKQPAPFIKKSQYRTQMTYPKAQTDSCMPLGKTEVFWGKGKEFPHKGSDFGYLIWRKRTCCLPIMIVPTP